MFCFQLHSMNRLQLVARPLFKFTVRIFDGDNGAAASVVQRAACRAFDRSIPTLLNFFSLFRREIRARRALNAAHAHCRLGMFTVSDPRRLWLPRATALPGIWPEIAASSMPPRAARLRKMPPPPLTSPKNLHATTKCNEQKKGVGS